MRVCSSCNIKSTRRSCPIPTCKTSKQKLKRLRSFPSKWDEVSEQLRDSVVAEFQIPQGVQACCCGCFNRISRKLGIPSKSKDTELEKWSNEEIELFKCGLQQFGKNWESILKMVTSKTKEDCQYLYLHFKEKLNVEASNKGDKQLDEDRIIERKLQDFGTKDEDSGEITSSCEEDNCIDRCSSDTASALSPDIGGEAGMKSKEVPETIDQNMNLRKSTDSLKNSLDYDSSATMSADEDQGQNGSQLRRKELNSIIQNILVSDDTIEPKDHVPVTKALSPIPVPCSQYNVPVGKGPCKGEPTCVRDLIYQAIEYSLQAPNKSSHTSTPVPVTSHSKGSYNSVEVRQEEIEACLSRPPQVVHGSSVLPVSIPDAEGLAMMAQFSQILLREQNEVQDLSKKDKDLRIPTQRISSQLPSGSGVLHQQIPYSQYGAPPPAHSNQYSRSSQPTPDILPLSSLDVSRDTHFSCLGRAGFAQSDSLHLQPPHLVAQASSPGPQTRRLTVPPPPSPSINISPGQQTLGLTVPLPPLITNSKPSNSKFPHLSSGSITQGTPLNLYPNPNIPLNPSNHEGLLRPIHPTQLKDVGSITHGTPLHDQKRPMKSNFCTVSACLPISGTEGGSNRRISPFSTEVLSKTAVPMTYEQVVDRECHRLTSSPYASSQSAYKISSNTIRAGFVSDTSSSKQLMIDFNTSKQMNRGSFTSDKESSKVQSSRDSSPHLLQQDSGLSQVCANVSFSAPEIHGTPLSTSMTDQSLSHSPENQWAFHRRQPDLQSFNAALSQPLSRQNIIRSITWGTGKPSVIQVPKSSSSCSPQSFSPATEKKPPSPHPASHPVLALSHDDFNTLVDTAIAQPSLTILKEDKRPELNRSPLNQTFMQSEQRSLTNMQQHPRSLCESSSSDSPRLQEYYKIEPIQRYFSSKVEGEDERESLPQIADRTSCLPAHYRCGVDNIVAGEQRLNHQLSSSIHSMQEPFTQEKFEQELINAKNGKDQKTAQNWNEEMKETSPVDAKRKLENPLHLGHFHHQSELGREAARILSESFQKEKPKVRPTNNQFTAVHLIDAIITRQISQNPDTEPRNHNLDNSFVHQLNESLTRQRAIKGSLGNDEVTTTEETSAADRFGKTDTCRTHDHIQDDPVILDPVHVFTLKQQIEDIISKNYNCSSNCSVSTSAYSSTNTGSVQSTVTLDIPRKGTSEFLTYSGVSRNLPSVDSHCSTVNGRRPIEGVTSVTVTSCSSLGESDHLAKDCPGSRCVYHSWKLRKALQSERNYTSLDTQSLGTSSIPNHNERHTTYVTHEARPSSRPPGHHHTLPLTSYAVEPISPPLQKNEANNELSNENVLGNILPTLSQNFTWSPSASIAGMFASKQHHPQSPCSTSNHHQMNLSPLDYVKNKIVEVMKTESIEIQSQTLGNHQAVRNENLKFPSLQHTMNESTNLLERPQSNGNSISPQQPQSSQIKPIYNTWGVTISQASSDVGFIQPVESSKGLKRSFDTAGLEEPRLTSKSVSSSSSDLGVELGKRSRIDYTSLPKSSTEQVLQELPESSESTLQEFLQLSSSGRCCDNNNLVTKGYNSPYTVTGSGISDSSPQAIQQEDRVSGVESSTDDNGNERRQCEVTSGNSEDRLLPDASSQLVDSPGSSGEMIVDESSNVNNTSSSRIEPISPLQERVSTSGQIEGFEEATSSTSSDVAQNNTVTSSFCQSSSAQVSHSPYGPSASVSSSTIPCSSPGPSSSVMPSGSPSYSSFTGVSTTYAYPFSALTVRSVGHPENSATSPQSSVPAMALVYSTNQFTLHGPSLGSSNNCPSSASRDPQPVSLLSSQYEPLSDED